MPFLFIAAALLRGGDSLGGRGIFGLAVMAALIGFAFVMFLREARDLENDDH